MKKEISPATAVIAIIVVIAIVALAYWTLGRRDTKSSETANKAIESMMKAKAKMGSPMAR